MIFGAGRNVLEYDSRGSPVCGGPITGPTVRAGIQHRSLPWRVASVQAGNVTINYQTPACTSVDATAVGTGTQDQTTTIEVETYLPVQLSRLPSGVAELADRTRTPTRPTSFTPPPGRLRRPTSS